MQQMYKVNEVANKLSLSVKTVKKYLDGGVIFGHKVGLGKRKSWRISDKAISDFLINCEYHPSIA